MFGNMEEMQKELQEKLAAIEVTGEAGDGAVIITGNANRKITNVSINTSSLDLEDSEQLEDLILVAVNRVIENASAEEAKATEDQLKNIMPPGLDGLSNLFG